MYIIYKTLEKKYEIQKEKDRYQQILNLSSDGVYIINLDGKLIECSEPGISMLGYTKEELQTMSIYDFNPIYTQEMHKDILEKMEDINYVLKTKHKRKDGSIFDVQITARLMIFNEKSYIYASARDISKEKTFEEKLQKERDFAFSIVNNSSMILLTNGKEIEFANKALLTFFDCNDKNEFKDKYKCICYEFIEDKRYFYLENDEDKNEWVERLLKLPLDKRMVCIKSVLNSELKVFSIFAIKHEKNSYLINLTDISEQMAKQLILENKVIHDKLTNAYSREYFDISNQAIIAENMKINKKTAIAMFDLDDFKQVNDTYGHDVGDAVLVELVKVIKKNSRDDDVLIRWGGEEFIIILAIKNKNDLYRILENYRKTIENYTFTEELSITCSLGGAIYKYSENIHETIKRADNRLYKSKNNGKNCITLKD